LSSALIYVDHLLFANSPASMHVHSLLWLAAMLAAGAVLLRRIEGPGLLAPIAAVLFALDGAHILPATWLANRNSLVATTFALLALAAHRRWRAERWRPGMVLGPACFALGLLAGEFALGAGAFFLSYALFLDDGRPPARALSLLPYAILATAWRVAYVSLGYGAAGSGWYIDPGSSPLAFLDALAGRLPVMAASLVGPPLAGLTAALPGPFRMGLVALSLAWIALASVALWPFLRDDRTARFWGLGALLALFPSSATFPHDRMLMLAGIGAAGLLSRVLALQLENPASTSAGRLARAATGVFLPATLLFHLALPAATAPLSARVMKEIGALSDSATDSLPAGDGLAGKTVVVMNAPDFFLGSYLAVWRASRGMTLPARLEVLTNGLEPVTFTRVGDRALEAEVARGHFNAWTHPLVRPVDEPMPPGTRIRRPGCTYEILDTAASGQPRTVRVTFDRDLDDPALLFLRWDRRGYAEAAIPPVGERTTLEIDPLDLLPPG
jgi:hypothetical protein